MTVEVVPLTEADIPEAIEVIQQAFAEDPYFEWVFDSPNVSHVPQHPSSVSCCGSMRRFRYEMLFIWANSNP